MITGAEGKALFIYNSLFNRIEGNHFERSAVGIHLTAGSEDNRITGNVFAGNQRQVKYVATRRSAEHTSELQSLMRISYADFCLKNNNSNKQTVINNLLQIHYDTTTH